MLTNEDYIKASFIVTSEPRNVAIDENPNIDHFFETALRLNKLIDPDKNLLVALDILYVMMKGKIEELENQIQIMTENTYKVCEN